MHRFFLEESKYKIINNKIKVDEKLLFQLTKILRIKNEDFVVILNNYEYIVKLENNEIILKSKLKIIEQKYKTILIQSLPKNSKIDLIIQKAVELNVSEIYFYLSERSISRISEIDFKSKNERYLAIAKEAAEQSRKQTTIKINFAVSQESLPNFDNYLKFVFYEKEENILISNFEKEIEKSNIAFVIGPEGGFSLNEINNFKKSNYKILSLGKDILRTETSSFFVLSIIKYLREKNDK